MTSELRDHLDLAASMCKSDIAAHGGAGARDSVVKLGLIENVIRLLDREPALTSPDRIPSDVLRSLRAYADGGAPVGEGLRAVLVGDLFTAMSLAPEAVIRELPAIVAYIRTSMPAVSIGSPEAVSRWSGKVRS